MFEKERRLKRLKPDVIRMAEHKWETKREAYCAGYAEGKEFGEMIKNTDRIPLGLIVFIIGVVVGAVVI